MTAARSTQRRTVLEKNASEVVALLATGTPHHEVATAMRCSASAVTKFEDRHLEEIEAIRAEVAREVSDYAIASKVNRIAAFDADWSALGTDLEAKRGGDYKAVVALTAERRALARAAAEELGQLPRPDVKIGDSFAFTLNIIGAGRRELG